MDTPLSNHELADVEVGFTTSNTSMGADCLPPAFFHGDRNTGGAEKISPEKTMSTYPESRRFEAENVLRRFEEKMFPFSKSLRYSHSSTGSESPDLEDKPATHNQTATSPCTTSEILSPTKIINKRDTALEYQTQVLLDCRTKEMAMKTSRKANVYYSQPLSSETNLDACFPKGMAITFSGPVLCECTQSSGASNYMEHIRPEDYQLFTTNTASIKADLHKKLRLLLGNPQSDDSIHSDTNQRDNSELLEDMSVGRYFDALERPELEILKEREQTLIPRDKKWPFLLRFPIISFAIPMGLGSQTILWKDLALSPAMHFLRIPKFVNLILWYLCNVALVTIFATYGMKCIFYFEAVRREYHHPVRINYFFTPWISCMFLTLGLPPSIAISIHPTIWCIFMMPILLLELKIYGQWLSGGERRLSKVANPSTHMAVVGNFVVAQLGAVVGWKEFATAFWAIGLLHYLVVFVTLYQRLPTNEALSRELHPIFFLFIAAPSAASVAWEMIMGEFDFVSKIVYFLALFLFSSLVVRLNFFRGLRFSIAWWAYIFPLTAASIATIHYSQKVTTLITQGLAAAFSFFSAAMVFTLVISTCHTCLRGDFFPNDAAIAITSKRRKLTCLT